MKVPLFLYNIHEALILFFERLQNEKGEFWTRDLLFFPSLPSQSWRVANWKQVPVSWQDFQTEMSLESNVKHSHVLGKESAWWDLLLEQHSHAFLRWLLATVTVQSMQRRRRRATGYPCHSSGIPPAALDTFRSKAQLHCASERAKMQLSDDKSLSRCSWSQTGLAHASSVPFFKMGTEQLPLVKAFTFFTFLPSS